MARKGVGGVKGGSWILPLTCLQLTVSQTQADVIQRHGDTVPETPADADKQQLHRTHVHAHAHTRTRTRTHTHTHTHRPQKHVDIFSQILTMIITIIKSNIFNLNRVLKWNTNDDYDNYKIITKKYAFCATTVI